MHTTDPPVNLSPAQAAHRYGVCRQTIYNLMNNGTLPNVKVGGRRFVNRAAADAVFGATKGTLKVNEENGRLEVGVTLPEGSRSVPEAYRQIVRQLGKGDGLQLRSMHMVIAVGA